MKNGSAALAGTMATATMAMTRCVSDNRRAAPHISTPADAPGKPAGARPALGQLVSMTLRATPTD